MKKSKENYEGFDYEAYDAEHRTFSDDDDIFIDADETEPFIVVVTETVKKYVTVWTETPSEALDWARENIKKIDMEKDIDYYKRTVELYEEG